MSDEPIAQQRIPANIADEMRQSYMDYAMSVIIGRALPDVRDGLKPANRRVLYGMQQMGLQPGRPYRKSAKVAGEVMGNYHPHGEGAIYDTLVRMAQDWNMRAPLVDGQGNFGSVDGDPPAAMRYTEARLTRLGASMMADIEKETVDFIHLRQQRGGAHRPPHRAPEPDRERGGGDRGGHGHQDPAPQPGRGGGRPDLPPR